MRAEVVVMILEGKECRFWRQVWKVHLSSEVITQGEKNMVPVYGVTLVR